MKTSIVDSFTKLLFYAGSILFVCLIAVLFVSVISRYCLGHSFSWSEEVYSFLFIWVSYIGVILAWKTTPTYASIRCSCICRPSPAGFSTLPT